MAERFEGFSAEAIDWLVGIKMNNSREYFIKNQTVYECSVKGPFIAFLTLLSEEFGGTPKFFRPQRDIRFSPDKTPYKTNAAGYLSGGDKHTLYYVSLSADSLFAATGYYQMAADQLKRYRTALSTDENAVELGNELRIIVARDGVEGEQLKTAPRGVAKDAVNLDLLRYKSLIVTGEIDAETADRETATAHASAVWKRGKALNEWLGRNVGPSTLER